MIIVPDYKPDLNRIVTQVVNRRLVNRTGGIIRDEPQINMEAGVGGYTAYKRWPATCHLSANPESAINNC